MIYILLLIVAIAGLTVSDDICDWVSDKIGV